MYTHKSKLVVKLQNDIKAKLFQNKLFWALFQQKMYRAPLTIPTTRVSR